MDRLIPILTPISSRWTVPLKKGHEGRNKGRGQEQSQREKGHEGISNRRGQEQSQMNPFGVKEVERHFE
jgi:hypothetical protein